MSQHPMPTHACLPVAFARDTGAAGLLQVSSAHRAPAALTA
jgi:hypothetical protein